MDAIIIKKSKSLLKQDVPKNSVTASFVTGNAAETPEVQNNSVDLIVTSPPFLDIVNYASDNWMRCWFCGIDEKKIPITTLKKERDWKNFVGGCFKEFARVLKGGAHVAFEVGEVRSGKVLLESLVLDAIRDLPFDVVGILINSQKFTKTSNCWGVSNNSGGTNTNRIVLVRRRVR